MTWLGEIFGMAQYRQNKISLDKFTNETNLTDLDKTQSSVSIGFGYRVRLEL